MREADLISEMRRALRRQGVWGARAERLLQDWGEHVRETAAQQVADGAHPEAANQAAWQALGAPKILAARAASELARSSWLGRHPWLAGLLLPLAGWLLVMTIAVFAAMAMVAASGAAPRPSELTTLEIAIDWVPWLLACSWLAWLVRHMPGGWKLYWISAVVLALLSTSMICQIQPPTHGPNTGVFLVTLGGIPGAILNQLASLFHLRERAAAAGRTLYPAPSSMVPWIQITLSAAGMIAVRRWSWSSFGPAHRRSA
ncbi:MAG: hypothetical protein P4L99_07195 [Chthoniobacter sp.]|nr:hypothetical protein [Chthoniobacter sp.]